jgi:hypothetical protein
MQLDGPSASNFDACNLTILATDYWTVLVRKSQVTIGSLIVAANRAFVPAVQDRVD